jgi:ELWxxDGT repeat protein
MATAGAALSLMGLLLGATGKAEAVQVSRVTDIYPGSGTSYPIDLTVFNNALYFSADDGVNGRELWKYDGTTVSLVADIFPGSKYSIPSSSLPGGFTVFNNALYFNANDGVHGTELWKYDGTTANLVADINPSQVYEPFNASNLTVFNNALYFRADDGAHGRELWKYDGTTASLVADINQLQVYDSAGFPLNSSNPYGFTKFDNTLYFSADDGVNGPELWKYDGTTASLVADINVSHAISPFALTEGSYPGDLTVFNNALYFRANNGTQAYFGGQLWKYDGTTASLVTDIFPNLGRFGSGPSDFTVFNNALYFSANDGINGRELWKYDGTTVSLVADINPSQAYSPFLGNSNPIDLTLFNNALYFSADDGVKGQELWKYDGITASLVADINPGSENSNRIDLTVFNNALYFSAYDGVHGTELWKLQLDEPTSVPEPASTFGLLAFGALGTGSMLKRKRQKAA